MKNKQLTNVPPPDGTAALSALDAAAAAGKITPDAVRSIRAWLTEPRYAEYAPEVARQIGAGLWKELDDVFWTVIPFGTGGRRGRMYPIGSNAINDRTIGESAQGVADYVLSQRAAACGNSSPLPFAGEGPGVRGAGPTRPPSSSPPLSPSPRPSPVKGEGEGEDHVEGVGDKQRQLSCAIAYDTRHQSRHFAELCSEIMVAAGFKVFFLDGFRSTPELSFAVRHNRCDCGIMVTASHNPPSDNAVKVYWSTGGQVLPPHDAGIIDRVMHTQEIRRQPFAEALAAGQVVYCQAEVDAAFLRAVHGQAIPGPRDLRIIYSPLHGVGASAVLPALAADGFKEVELFGPQATPDPDFLNVPNHVANPENPGVFDSIIVRARETHADLILASDPDCDRLGCAAPRAADRAGPWETFTGNQIAALLADYLLAARRQAGTLSPQHYVVKTLVTTELVRRIAAAYGVRTLGNLQVGFKYIGQTMDEAGPDRFVFGCEESHGYLVGQYARDKDAVVAAMLLSELAAVVKSQGQTLHERLDALYRRHGYHAERQFSLAMPGSEGMKQMQSLMARFRSDPPSAIGSLKVVRARDYESLTERKPGGPASPLDGPRGDMVMLDLEGEGNYLAIRPSGTEPKVKFYLFAFEPPERSADLAAARAEVAARLDKLQADLAMLAK